MDSSSSRGSSDGAALFDVRTYLATGQLAVKPCLEVDSTTCQKCATKFTHQLDRLVEAINRGELTTETVTSQELQNLVEE